jgi:TPR repeat protein
LAAITLLLQGTEDAQKDAVLLLEKGCNQGDADSCLRISVFAKGEYPTKEKLDKQKLIEKAQTLYEARCDEKDGSACGGLGELLANPMDSKPDLKKAVEYFELGCELEDGRSCAQFASFLEQGKGVIPDIEAAELMFRHSCDLNSPRGCAWLGIFLRDRGEMDEALKSYRKSCSLWGGLGCYEVGVAYDTGTNVEVSKQQALEHYKKSCNLQYPGGCNNVGRMYQTADGVRQDYDKALAHYLRVCDTLAWERGRRTKEIIADACNNVGAVYSKGLGVNPDGALSLKYFSKACQLGEQMACKNRNVIKKEVTKASRFDLVKQCGQGSAKGCYELGIMWGNGDDGPKDLKQAKHWVKLACDKGYEPACELLPSMRETE